MPSVEIFPCKFNCFFKSPIFNRVLPDSWDEHSLQAGFLYAIYQVVASNLQTFKVNEDMSIRNMFGSLKGT